MMIYLFDKRIYKVDVVEAMTKEQAEREYLDDIVGAVLLFTNAHTFATSFNNGNIETGVFLMKIF